MCFETVERLVEAVGIALSTQWTDQETAGSGLWNKDMVEAVGIALST